MSVRGAGVVADINRCDVNRGMVLAIPVAPIARSRADVENFFNCDIPPDSEGVHCIGKRTDRVARVYRIIVIETAVIILVKSRANHDVTLRVGFMKVQMGYSPEPRAPMVEYVQHVGQVLVQGHRGSVQQ